MRDEAAGVDWPIIGSEAIAEGLVTRGALRWNYRRLFPDVYFPADARLDIGQRAYAAWLWTGRAGVVTGQAAAALYGVRCVDDSVPIEMIAKSRRPRPGVVIRNESLAADEVEIYGEQLPVTTPPRTALELARHLSRDQAVKHLDMLAAATDMTRADVAPLEARYPSTRWSRKAFDALTLMDGGSRSPEETMVRLWLIDAGLPRPQTGISVGDRIWEAEVGIGWPEFRIGVQWAEHRYNLVSDIHFRDLLRRLRWQLIEVGRHHSRANVVKRCRDALLRRPLC